ncbi:ATP synthase-coupling factor 6, mitochondrial-like [Corticium candelabrum]|uniref:ATP synthase-coupling factor 6, mitochondrial-like n=1 Tax=Corticium candelabrum TaxID=121492 RepID=UPI002E2672F0|nr:ATP synthase-coupling factor 6, mitochondrial-like [Corticium candelabrum]
MALRVPTRLFSFVGALRRSQTELDPVQRLFADKVKEYQEKSRKNPGKLVDVTPEFEAHITGEKERLKRIYGGGDMSQFPKFDFKKS